MSKLIKLYDGTMAWFASEQITWLLDQCPVNRQDQSGDTVLHLAKKGEQAC